MNRKQNRTAVSFGETFFTCFQKRRLVDVTGARRQCEQAASVSYRRAIETKNYLVNKGIAPERLITKAYGDTQPIAPNVTAEGRRKNRRINFVLREKL